MQGSNQRKNVEDEGSDREVFGRERCDFLLREIEEKWEKMVLKHIYRKS